MNKTTLFTIAGILVAVIGWGEMRYHMGREAQRNVDLLASAETTKTLGEPYNQPAPAETLQGQGTRLTPPPATPHPRHEDYSGAVLDAKVSVLQAVVDSLATRIEQLEVPAGVTIVDSLGGTHEITFYPSTMRFTEAYTPVTLVQPTEVLIAHNLPAVPNPTADWWLDVAFLWNQRAGIAGTIGYRTLGFTYGNLGDKPLWGVQANFQLNLPI